MNIGNLLGLTNQDHPSKNAMYPKQLGWKEHDEEGNLTHAAIFVLRTGLGFSVFRFGRTEEHLFWTHSEVEAIEYAVDRARKEIADHELQQQKREVN